MQKEYVELDIGEVILKEPIRDDAGDLTILTASVSKLGILIPIIVDRNNVLIAGWRRLAACRAAGISQLPTIRLDTTYDHMSALDVQVDLNLCRLPLTTLEVDKLISKKQLASNRAGSGDKGVLPRIRQLIRK
ncbi:MAG: ParB N-terminal domain-containing protein [Lentisphaerae bacterium]|nr:ParB N-terminal domain-containing protein [Lentisphaerota bacterium]